MRRGKAGKKSSGMVYRGFAALFAALLALVLAGMPVVETFRSDIDKFLGTTSTAVVTTDGSDSLYRYQTKYADTTELVQAFEKLGTQMSAEGSVLLKNNGALPVKSKEKGKVTLLGCSSYIPLLGGTMGASVKENVGTDADTVDFVAALEARGYTVNPTVSAVYASLDSYYNKGNGIFSVGTTGDVYTSVEPTLSMMDEADAGWRKSLEEYNVILMTITRSGGENASYLPGEAGVDRSQKLNQSDPLGLNDNERALIDAAAEAAGKSGGKVVLLLNNGSAMEIQELEDHQGVDAILQIGFPGGYGFYGIADILDGTANPSGHLTDTYATDISASPAAQNYGDYEWTNAVSDWKMNAALVEAEGIYTGYKYYETRYADVVMGQGNAGSSVGSSTGEAWAYADEVTYPFGYGLSYTTFDETLEEVSVDTSKRQVSAKVTVKNTGKTAGKHAVQLYVSVPYTQYDAQHGIEKSAVQLLDYAKTNLLEPGKSETLEIVGDMDYMTSWDCEAPNAAGTKGCYILDEGTYFFSVGNGAHEALNNILAAWGYTTASGMTEEGNAQKVKTWDLEHRDETTFATSKNGTKVENQLADMDLNYWMEGTVTYLTRNDWAGTFPKTYEGLTATQEMLDILDNDTYVVSADHGDTSGIVFEADNGLALSDLIGADFDDERWELLLDQLSLKECMLETGFGGTNTPAMSSVGSPEAVESDAPNGMNTFAIGRFANYDAATGDPCAIEKGDKNAIYIAGVMPNAVVIAQTFSKDLAKEFGELIGDYSLWANQQLWFGIAMNIHRCPYNGRNYEYYSEDPVLSSYQGAATIEGNLEYGLLPTVKHLAFNDTEINRIGISVFMTEQNARESELRAMQSAFEDAKTLGAMTSYNRIGIYTANAHPTFLLGIVRGEWGFRGLLTEDYITDGLYTTLKEGVINSVTMTLISDSMSWSALEKKYGYWTEEQVSSDAQLLTALKRNMKYHLYALANSNAMDGIGSNTKIVSVKTWYDYLLIAVGIVSGIMTVLSAAAYFRLAFKNKKEAKGQ